MSDTTYQRKHPLEFILGNRPVSSNFPATSRYHGIPTAQYTNSHGKTYLYLRRRFVSSPEAFSDFQEHVVSQGERPDHLATRYLGDPELFWQLCDANRSMKPDELTEAPGRTIRITLPEGV